MTHFDAIIVGAGQAGPPLAGRLTDAGQTVAVIERKLVGGTCVNSGCIPTKTLVASAHTAHAARRGADYGGVFTGDISVDMAKVKARKDGIVLGDRSGVESWIEGMPGCTLIRGHARFSDPHTIRVGDDVLTAYRIFLNVGGRAVAPDLPGGLADIDYLTNVGILELDTLPEHLVIVGGSYIGLEFAQMYRRFARASPCSSEDLGLRHVKTPTSPRPSRRFSPTKASPSSPGHRTFDSASATTASTWFPLRGAQPIVGSHLLVAVGRQPNTDDLGLDRAGGVEVDSRGYIVVDDQLRTTAEHIWAMGGTVMARAPSPTPPTTTTRSWRPTCSTTTRGGSATGCRRTRSTSTRRSAGPV